MHCHISWGCFGVAEQKGRLSCGSNEVMKESCKSQRSHQNSWMELLRPGKWKYSCIFNDLKKLLIKALAMANKLKFNIIFGYIGFLWKRIILSYS